MPTASSNHPMTDIDIESIVRLVLDRMEIPVSLLGEKVVTAATVAQLDTRTRQVRLLPNAILTPSAKDELRGRGIVVHRAPASVVNRDATPPPIPARLVVSEDTASSKPMASVVVSQLLRRGITATLDSNVSPTGVTCHLSDKPAAGLMRFIGAGHATVLISRLEDVERFADEAQPRIFMIDLGHMNLASVVNAAVRVAAWSVRGAGR